METDQGYEVKQQNRGEGHPGGCLESRLSLFVTNLVTFQTPGVSDILLSLTRQDVGAVVTTLLMMDNAPAENISGIWSGLAVDQEVAEQLLEILLESITFDKIRQNLDEKSSSRLTERLVMAVSVILESRRLSDMVR